MKSPQVPSTDLLHGSRRQTTRSVVLFAATFLAGACGDGGAEESDDATATAAEGFSTRSEEPGENCEAGGVALIVAGEAVDYVCNGVSESSGSEGADDTDAADSSDVSGDSSGGPDGVETVAEPPGDHCAAGGFALQSNGETLGYVCSGVNGVSPSGGLLLSRTPIAPGAGSVCAWGGQQVAWGADADANGVLDAEEVENQVTACAAAPSACTGSYAATTNAEVAALAACGEVIHADILIDGASITDLSPLSGLTSIYGNLMIGALGTADLTGLDNLREVRGDLSLGMGDEFGPSRPFTVDSAGLGSLEAVYGRLSLWDNGTVHDFQNMSALKHIGRLFFSERSGVVSFDGLEGLTTLTLDGYPQGLASFEGLNNLTELRGEGLFLPLGDYRAPVMPSLEPLQNLRYVSALSLQENFSDSSELAQLTDLHTFGNIYVGSNSGADVDVSALDVRTIEGDLAINSQASGLAEMLGEVTRIGGSLSLGYGVTEVSFLPKLESIGWGLEIQSLTSFDGLASLVSLGDQLPADYPQVTIWTTDTVSLCGMTSLSDVAGHVSYYDHVQRADVVKDASEYFDTLPEAACGEGATAQVAPQ